MPTSRLRKQSQFKAKYLSLLVALLLISSFGMCLGGSQTDIQALGELRLEGKFIEQLTLLRNDGQKEVLNDPEETLMLPVGKYLVQEIRLKGGYNRLSIPRSSKLTISDDIPAKLKMGGPLKQTISVQRHGRVLELTYGLVGIGGETYSGSRNTNKRPGFAIYKGDRRIATGKFEFG